MGTESLKNDATHHESIITVVYMTHALFTNLLKSNDALCEENTEI